MNENIQLLIEGLKTNSIIAERKVILKAFAKAITASLTEKKSCQIIFICTHNSRRSHFTQIWAKSMAHYYNITGMETYSGGTEVTAINAAVLMTLEHQGFSTTSLSKGDNQVWSLKTGPNSTPIIAFSKKVDHEFNPQNGFIAIMTCSQADEGCPFVSGASQRISLAYEDPKVSDGTPEQSKVYTERSLEIATEMKYVFEQLTS